MEEILTYLEMTGPGRLRPAPVVPGLALVPADDGRRAIRDLQERVAAPHHWTRLGWADERWATWLADPGHRQWRFEHGGEAIGVLELAVPAGGEVEIAAFGLLPSHVGRSLGGYALTLATAQAWRAVTAAGEPASRVWLYTSSLDHPHAVPNYRRRGFEPYRAERRARPDLDGVVR